MCVWSFSITKRRLIVYLTKPYWIKLLPLVYILFCFVGLVHQCFFIVHIIVFLFCSVLFCKGSLHISLSATGTALCCTASLSALTTNLTYLSMFKTHFPITPNYHNLNFSTPTDTLHVHYKAMLASLHSTCTAGYCTSFLSPVPHAFVVTVGPCLHLTLCLHPCLPPPSYLWPFS